MVACKKVVHKLLRLHVAPHPHMSQANQCNQFSNFVMELVSMCASVYVCEHVRASVFVVPMQAHEDGHVCLNE